MGSSLQDQLLKLGVVDKKQAGKAKKKQHDKRKQQIPKKQAPPVDENKLLAEQALAKKKERAKQLNLEREEKLRKREEVARIRQMIEQSRLPKDDKKGVAYRFVDQKKVFRIFISQELIDSLSRGTVGIVRLNDQYEVCPAEIVKKIREMDSNVVVVLNKRVKDDKADEDDPYAGYEVPDDLMW